MDMFGVDYKSALRIWNFKRLLSENYEVVVTNPPYMGGKGQSGVIVEYLKNNYPDTKSDTFSAFIERCGQLCKQNGYIGMFTPYVWMFIQSYEKLRRMICHGSDIITLIQFEYSAFEEATVPVCTFVLRNKKTGVTGEYLRLVDFRGGMEVQRIKTLEAIANRDCGFRYTVSVENFSKIPGSPISYWASENVLSSYANISIKDISKPCKGIDTGNNDIFLRLWFEIDHNSFAHPESDLKKWVPYNKGGAYRKWYGNNEYVLDWSENGLKLKSFRGSNLRNKDYYFHKGITWSTVTSAKPSFRYFTYGYVFDNGGCCLYANHLLIYIQALLNSCVALHLMQISPTLNFQPGDIGRVPVIKSCIEVIEEITQRNIKLSWLNWDSFETSWDFKSHPLI
jgi:hypothetical protein